MSEFYDDMVLTAIELVTEFGAIIQHIPQNAAPSSYDMTTGKMARNPSTTIDRMALLIDQPGNRLNKQDGQTLQDGSLVHKDDKWIYMVPDAQAPQLQDTFIVQGAKYVCKNVQRYGPGGQDLLYLVVMRR